MGTLQDLPRITCLELDVTSEESIRKAHEAVSATTNGTLDILVNNAAIAFVKPMLDFEMDEARLTMETNFWGPLNLIRTFAPDLIKSKGCIVNISTFVSKMYGPYMGKYNFHNHLFVYLFFLLSCYLLLALSHRTHGTYIRSFYISSDHRIIY